MIQSLFEGTGLDYDKLMNIPNFEYIKPMHVELIYQKIMEHRNGKIILLTDSDVDGFVCSKIMYETLKRMNIKCDVYVHPKKHHGFTDIFIQKVIVEKYNLVIATDACSNDYEYMKYLNMYGVDTIIIDHHNVDMGYDRNMPHLIFCNCRLEQDTRLHNISAGFYVYLYSYFIGGKHNVDLFDLGAWSIFSDSCSLKSMYNRSILAELYSHPYRNRFLEDFRGRYMTYNRYFMVFYLSPRINLLFRYEYHDIIHSLIVLEDINRYIEFVNDFYRSERIVKNIRNNLVPQDLVNSVFADLTGLSTLGYTMSNFTGLIANEFLRKYNKPAICISLADKDTYKGSIRSTPNINVYSLLEQLDINYGGHPYACGFTVLRERAVEVLDELNKLINSNIDLTYKPLMCKINDLNDIYYRKTKLALMIALYNEYSGSDVETARFEYTVQISNPIEHTEYVSKIKFYDMEVIVFDTDVNYGDTILITPTMDKNGIRYLGNKHETY